MSRRRPRVARPLIPPSPEVVARQQLATEEQKRARLCLQAIEAVLAEHGCRFHVLMQQDSSGRPPVFQVSVETIPTPPTPGI